MSPTLDKHLLHLVEQIYGQVRNIATLPTRTGKKDTKNIILFVGKVYAHMVDAVRKYEKEEKKKFRIALLHDAKIKPDQYTQNAIDNKIDFAITCNTKSNASIQKSLLPFRNEILVVTTRSEDQIPLLAKVIPHVPYLQTPTTESLLWSVDKLATRKRLDAYDPNISPAFDVITDDKKETIKKLISNVKFPMIVKPSGMAASRLVSLCFHEEELTKALKEIFKKVEKAENATDGKVLVEHYMEGEMYSIDAYVTATGNIHFCPMAHIKTGKRIGFDDFFGYQQITPTLLKKESIADAEFVAAEAIHALGLRSTSAHVELMRTEDGWKVIEVGPRVGGFRHMMYEHSYHINHTMNDVLVRTGQKPKIPKRIHGYTVAMKFFAKKEGKIKKIVGIKKIQDLDSFKRIYINKKAGDTCAFAKNGGDSVFNIIMFNKDRSELLADIRRLEQTVSIETE